MFSRCTLGGQSHTATCQDNDKGNNIIVGDKGDNSTHITSIKLGRSAWVTQESHTNQFLLLRIQRRREPRAPSSARTMRRKSIRSRRVIRSTSRPPSTTTTCWLPKALKTTRSLWMDISNDDWTEQWYTKWDQSTTSRRCWDDGGVEGCPTPLLPAGTSTTRVRAAADAREEVK
jgi:hypothetical protein